MGGDFQQYRSLVNCGQKSCVYSNVTSANTSVTLASANKTSHFHCLKCDYVCADTNKVVAHRRQHDKMDSISAAGFEKFSPLQDCQKELCNYKLKQTHYHCLTCNYSVLGLSQMSSHKFKHQQQTTTITTTTTTTTMTNTSWVNKKQNKTKSNLYLGLAMMFYIRPKYMVRFGMIIHLCAFHKPTN